MVTTSAGFGNSQKSEDLTDCKEKLKDMTNRLKIMKIATNTRGKGIDEY
jgi:hypothetical protein